MLVVAKLIELLVVELAQLKLLIVKLIDLKQLVEFDELFQLVFKRWAAVRSVDGLPLRLSMPL